MKTRGVQRRGNTHITYYVIQALGLKRGVRQFRVVIVRARRAPNKKTRR